MSLPGCWIACDRCDFREPVGSSAVNEARLRILQQQGWRITRGPNYCPACVKIMDYEAKRT